MNRSQARSTEVEPGSGRTCSIQRSTRVWVAAGALLLGLIALGAPVRAVAQALPGMPAVESPVLSPGDLVLINVWRKPELSGEFSIAADGSISHPLYRSIQAAGLPMPMVEQRLREFLRGYEANPEFVVTPLLRVGVGGQVIRPNLYNFPPETTIAQAIALAGGATDRGRLDRVRLVRSGEEIFVDLTSAQTGMAQMPIRSGDQLMVYPKRSVFREYVVPAMSVAGAVAAVANVVIRWR